MVIVNPTPYPTIAAWADAAGDLVLMSALNPATGKYETFTVSMLSLADQATILAWINAIVAATPTPLTVESAPAPSQGNE